MLKRLLIGAVATASLVAVPALPGDAQTGATVTVVHGIGPAPSAVDVYVGPVGGPLDLFAEDFQYGDTVTTDEGAIAPGEYTVLLCAAVASPLAELSDCSENSTSAVNSNFGTNVLVGDGGSYTLVAAYGDPETGRPTVLAYENNLDCVDTATTARVTAVHAATAPEVNVLADGEPLFGDVAWGDAVDADLPIGGATAQVDVGVELASDNTPVLDLPDVEVEAQVNQQFIVVGNPQFDADFDVLVVEFPLEACAQPTTTTTTVITTTTTVPPRPVQVTPAFTG